MSDDVVDGLDDLLDELSEPASRSAKTGRRARAAKEAPPPPVEPADDDMPAETFNTNSSMKPLELGDGGPPPRPGGRRMSGWAAEGVGSAGKRRGLEVEEDERLRPTSAASNDSDNDIPVIPDLEDAQEEDLTQQVAVAPTVAINRLAAYRELDNDLLRHAAFLTLDNDIDLKVLAKCLSSEADVVEEDKPWDWDRLFTEVTSELNSEWESKEVKEEEAIQA